MKIKSNAIPLHAQRVRGNNNEFWTVPDILAAAQDLEVMEIPLDHLCIDSNIVGVPIKKIVEVMKHILEVNLDYSIVLDENGAIFDGRHRVAKALFEGRKTIKAKRFNNDPPPSGYEKK